MRSSRVALHVVDVGDGDEPPAETRPIVKIIPGRRNAVIDRAEGYLIERDPDLYQRGAAIVRLAPQEVDIGSGRKIMALRIVRVGVQHLRERWSRAVDFQKYDKRSKKYISCDPPSDLAEAYLERDGLWRLPMLRAFTTAPTLRPDGSILEKPGYDRQTGILFDPCGVEFPPVPPAPSRDDARAALDVLAELFATFDFIDEAARAVALSGVLTAVCRHAMTSAPLVGFDAPGPGAGKSKCVNIAAMIATGHYAPVLALGQRDEETEKRLGAALLAGDAIIALDNVERPVGGELLCQAITEPLVNTRILGTSTMLIAPNVSSWFCTGNNLRFLGDMIRRALIGRIDPGVERPELREFETPDPISIALERRPQLVVAALTIARAFAQAGCPRREPPLGSFPDWSRWVRDPLLWLGAADPVTTMESVRSDEPRLTALNAVLEAWAAVLGSERASAREAAARAEEVGLTGFAHPEFRAALLAVASDRKGGISAARLGTWLGGVKGRVVAGKRLESAGIIAGTKLWKLVDANR